MLTSLLAVAAISAPAHADGRLVGTWQGQGFVITFDASGQYASQVNGQGVQGQWMADGQTLQTAASVGQYWYRYQVQGDQLLLQDASGAQMMLQRATAQPAPAAAPAAPAASGGVMSQQEWLSFLETYPAMNPDQITAQLSRLDQNMVLMLEIYSALRSDILYRACHGSYAGQITADGGCGSIVASRQQAEMWAAQSGMPLIEHDTQRQQVANSVRCSLGMIDASTCQTYAGVTQNVNDMMHDTSMQIIENMGGGQCTEYFDQNNNYLGCW